MGTIANVLIGAANMYVAPAGTAPPGMDGDTIDWGAASFADQGFTQGGVEFDYAPEIFRAMVDQVMSPVKTELIGEGLAVRTGFAEADLDHLNIAMSASTKTTRAPGAGEVGQDILKGGSGSLVEKVLGFEGKSPEGFWRVVMIWRGHFIGAGGHSYKRDDMTLVPVEFAALADTSKAIGETLYQIIDKTAAGT